MAGGRRKAARGEAGGRIDPVGNLPDEIVPHIISLLPTVEAVRMGLILPLPYVWKCLRDLSFDECDLHVCPTRSGYVPDKDIARFVNFIDRVLALHDGPAIDRFCLKTNLNVIIGESIPGWIDLALSKKVKTMDLDLQGCSKDRERHLLQRFPVSMRGCHLVELSLTYCEVREVRFESLRKLKLALAGVVREQTMADIFAGCPCLEELSLRGMILKHLTVPKNHPLKRLLAEIDQLETLDLECSEVKALTMVASPRLMKLNCPPSMTKLDISGHIHNLLLKGTGSVNDAAIRLWTTTHNGLPICLYHSPSHGCKPIAQGEFLNVKLLLEMLRHSSRSELGTWVFLVILIWEIKERPSPSYEWKQVTVSLGLTKWIKPGIRWLLRQCNRLETLTVYFYPCNQKNLKYFSDKMREGYNLEEGSCGSLFEPIQYSCLENRLRKVTVEGCVTDPFAIQFIAFILGRALSLKEMVISARKNRGDLGDRSLPLVDKIQLKKECRVQDLSPEFRQQILTIPKVARSAVINFK
ncbi:hypothetical protein MLD38_019869 [Melastoma candidum]|uniref:Uncharacterized protein n=1 Tax=Melastoma candidum TaxID=119954 RepID=A0ACB9QBP9_9MYRT|nr:hypothetical protein MLD38_019869 [Melastoma candidum]